MPVESTGQGMEGGGFKEWRVVGWGGGVSSKRGGAESAEIGWGRERQWEVEMGHVEEISAKILCALGDSAFRFYGLRSDR